MADILLTFTVLSNTINWVVKKIAQHYSIKLNDFMQILPLQNYNYDYWCVLFPLQVVEELSQVEGLSKILVAEHEAYKGFLPGN